MTGRTFLGRYKTIQPLGEGGMGKVYLAYDFVGRREAVVKVLHEHIANQDSFRERFKQEMEFMTRFQHPNIVALFDSSLSDPNGPCIVMEYIPGVTLDTLLHRQARLSAVRAGLLLLPLCKALFAAHQAGVIHRDMKPANIMIADASKPTEVLKVMDFGLSSLATALYIPKERLDNPGEYFSACGTPDYMCPEQVRGDELDARSDLYSVGVILYEMLTGRQPFTRGTVEKTMLAHADDPPPPFAQMGVKDVPPAIETVVMYCLSKFPVERPATARELWERYEKALGMKLGKAADWVVTNGQAPRAASPEKNGAEPRVFDPSAIVEIMEAWMPERIAVVKLQGFVQDHGGEVIESVPGLLRVKFSLSKPVAQSAGMGFLSKLGLSATPEKRPFVELEMHMEKREVGQGTVLHITAVYKPTGGRTQAMSPGWRQKVNELHRDLRAYLMGRG
jgi:serine/threonine-protein kinase